MSAHDHDRSGSGPGYLDPSSFRGDPTGAVIAPDAPLVGDVIGDHFRVRGLLGRGGMGIVLLARDTVLERDVAVKLVAGDLIKRDTAKDRFLRETRTMATVRHENVVQIYGFGEWKGRPFFVMEYFPGQSVADWLDRYDDPAQEAPSVDECIGLIDQVCRGLAAIHEKGIVHADVKPGNVLIGHGFRAAVTDFGLVRALGERDVSELVVGTPAYIPPEVVYNRQPVYDKRADVWAMGVMAYEMFTGRLPFPIDSVQELFDVHRQRVPLRPATEVRADLPPALDVVLQKALARDLSERFSDTDELRKALARAREDTRASSLVALRFVVADDDADFRKTIVETLRFGFPGAEIVDVPDGSAALAALDVAHTDLAIIDLDMPGLNGIELTAAMRSPDRVRVPILVVTGQGGAPDWRLLQSLGADGFLVKPTDPYALIALARRALGDE